MIAFVRSHLLILLHSRGAPGRLMKLEDMQALLDSFGIPLQIGTGKVRMSYCIYLCLWILLQLMYCRESKNAIMYIKLDFSYIGGPQLNRTVY